MAAVAEASRGCPEAVAREPAGFAFRYALANFGAFYAIVPPTLGGLSIKLQELIGTNGAAQALGLVMGLGLLFGPMTQPLVGRLSDNTGSLLGMRRPWLFGGTAGFVVMLTAVGLVTNFVALL